MSVDDGLHDRYDERVLAAAIASLPGIGPQRLRLLVGGLGSREAWHVVRGDATAPDHVAALLRHNGLWRVMQRAATDELVRQTAEALRASNTRVVLADDPEYPASMRGDFAAPEVLFVRGNLSVFDKRRVGIIGTRAASASGRHIARSLARDLVHNDVAVVSGLARGIDAAAHRGALDDESAGGAPIAVVASGPDVVYPREHVALWRDVINRGVLVSESPPGCAPDAFRFPLRNRILAMVSEVLVVVESRATGGSMITVDEAVKRGVNVMAVPGSLHAESSAGTNRLIADGAATVCDVGDVLVALGLDHRRHTASDDTRQPPSARDARVLCALAKRPVTFDRLVADLDMPVVDVAISLGRLEVQGWAVSNGGWWEALLARELPFGR